MKNIRKLLVIMLASLLLFSGCGTADQEDSQESEAEMGSFFYDDYYDYYYAKQRNNTSLQSAEEE